MPTILRAIRHGVRCYATVRIDRQVRLRMTLPSDRDALAADFAAAGEDLKAAMQVRDTPTGQDGKASS